MGLAAFNRARAAQQEILEGSTKIADLAPQDEPKVEKPKRQKKTEEPQAEAPQADAPEEK